MLKRARLLLLFLSFLSPFTLADGTPRATLHWVAVCSGWRLIALDVTVDAPGHFPLVLDWQSVCQGV